MTFWCQGKFSPLCYCYLNTLLSASMSRACVYFLYYLAFRVIAVDMFIASDLHWKYFTPLVFTLT